MPRHRFAHWLTRHVGYEALLSNLRRGLHLAVATSLESVVGDAEVSSDDGLARSVVSTSSTSRKLAPVARDAAMHRMEAGDKRRAGLLLLLSSRHDYERGQFREAMA